MNKLVAALVMVLPFVAQTVVADDAHHPDKGAPQAAADSSSPVSAQSEAGTPDERLAAMAQHMNQAQALMIKIQNTTDAAERSKLLQEHMALMHEGMAMMNGMGGCPMMGTGMNAAGMPAGAAMMGGGMMQPGGADGAVQGSPMTPEAMQQRLETMQQRMNMMQMVMGQLLEHQQADGESTK